jgi:hypothetical protein
VIRRAVIVPHPPLLGPELVAGAAADTEPLRRATLAVATELAQVAGLSPAVGTDQNGPAALGPHARGTFAGFGVDVPVALSADAAAGERDPGLPLPALIAGRLREHAGADRVRVELVPPGLPAKDCVRAGERIAARSVGPELAAGHEWRGKHAELANPFGVACHLAVREPV